MVNKLYRLFLTFNATSLMIVIFMIKQQFIIIQKAPNWISYLILILIPFFLTGISLLLTKFLSADSIEGKAKDIEQANNAYLPSYLGYFFVALSVPYTETLIFVFLILFVFTYFSQTLYFNPLFLLWGKHFYYVTTENNIKIFLITKKILIRTNDIQFESLKRINNYTFIDNGGKKHESSDGKNKKKR